MSFELSKLGIEVVESPVGSPPFPVDARAVEEDTYLVLSADPAFRESSEHPLRVIDSAFSATPEEPGSVVVRHGPPLRFLAVVHDLQKEPSCREEWVKQAFAEIFRLARIRQLRSLGLPLLGTLHGKLKRERSLAILEEALRKNLPRGLNRLWLISMFILLIVVDGQLTEAAWRRAEPAMGFVQQDPAEGESATVKVDYTHRF